MGAEKPPPENIDDPLGWRGPPGLVRILHPTIVARSFGKIARFFSGLFYSVSVTP